MQESKPRRRRIFRWLLIVIVLVGGVSAAGVYFMNMTGEANAANGEVTEAQDEQTADASSGDKEGEKGEGTDAEGEAGDKEGDGEGEEEEEDKSIPVSVAEVAKGSVSSYITATANLVAENEVMVLAEAEGRVANLRVEEGDYVQAGQLLASLVKDDQEIAYTKAMVRATNAKATFDRSSRMGSQNMISEEDLERSGLDHEVAQQELAEAKWRLDKTEIRAPFSGRITDRMVTVGKHVRLGDELFEVTDFDPLIARIYLPEKDVIGLEEERNVRITLKADEGIRFDGRIRQISPVVDTETGTIKVTVEAINAPRGVRPGGFVTIDSIRETRPDVVLLPREAVIRELQRAHVFVAKGEVAEKRTVELGLEEGESMEAVSGIEAGEQVIVAGQGSLKNGSEIKIIPDSNEATAKDTSENLTQDKNSAQG
jgi:membrane fusion protein (multidrug efflux system)